MGTGCPSPRPYIQFRLGLRPRPHWGSPLAGWVGASCPFSKNQSPLSALRASIMHHSFFPRPHHFSPLNQKVKLPMCPRTSRYPLLNWYPPLFRPTLRPWFYYWSEYSIEYSSTRIPTNTGLDELSVNDKWPPITEITMSYRKSGSLNSTAVLEFLTGAVTVHYVVKTWQKCKHK